MKTLLFTFLLTLLACSQSSNDKITKANIKRFNEEPHEIIATQFNQPELIPNRTVSWNDDAAYLLEDTLYFNQNQFDLKIKQSSNQYKYSVLLDTNSIKDIFIRHNAIYGGQKRLFVLQ